MKICLVCYKYSVSINDPCCYPIGFMYVSAMLKELGHEVKVLNYNIGEYDFLEEVKNQDVVMFTGFEEFAKDIVRDATLCRQLGIKTSVGGALATFIPEVMAKYVDQVCVGEFGECSKIDQIPYPDYDGFGFEEYRNRHKANYIGVLTSRGCLHNCTFCAQTCKFRVRSIKSVCEEIEYYASKYYVSSVIFNDNTFNISKPRFLKLCDFMGKMGLAWSASIRCDLFDEDMARAAAYCGCVYFIVGVESFDQDKLNRLNKGIYVEDIYRTLDLLHKYRIPYHGNILLGFEDESYTDIAEELNLMPKYYNVFPALVQPFVGTKNGLVRSITEQEEDFLSEEFKSFVLGNQMGMYPSIKEMGLI